MNFSNALLNRHGKVSRVPVIVGFDLDMTLIDARPGVAAAIDAVGAEFDVPLVGAEFAAHLGPPVEHLLAQGGAPEELIPTMADRYRALYPSLAIDATVAMPGADDAQAAVRAVGGRIVVVTGKHRPNAARHLAALGWEVDHLAGDLWSDAKGEVLREQGATVYVGDHIGDMAGARVADVVAVGVTTGPCSAAELAAAGADVILDSLTDFPAWFAEFTA